MRKSVLEALAIDNDRLIKRLNAEIGRLVGVNGQLDGEADRQEVRILDLEGRLESFKRADALQSRDQVAVSMPQEPALCFDGAVALTAVAQMLEHRAENMAIHVGSDAAEYGSLCERAHLMRSIVRQIGPCAPNLEDTATELFELLASKF